MKAVVLAGDGKVRVDDAEDPRIVDGTDAVVEVGDARSEYARLAEAGVRFLAEPYEPPWGGCRFFCVDPDGYLVEIEQLA